MTGIIIYLLCFSCFCAGAAVWVLERRERRYRLGNYRGDGLLTAAGIFIFTYLGNFAVFFTWGAGRGLWLDLAILALLGAFIWGKERSYREEVEELRREQLSEAAALEAALIKDPANTARRERLAELYESLGDLEKALLHAEEAARMDPIQKNLWKVKTLKQELEERKS
ncbi:MAG: hypothetical protein A2X28_09220 [Elusimicrobia bacterium GWA2_56_46]|jgi:tetratricopeptide (TPR) repeat protein|nr:MAG: hypothetical protein A2X28_09220 [Elusimicrobia bacterium GWA2_56_46]OGR55602.1 MAG: hypothetical protein A2X39_08750 [Elusimicrobia bacterium GWC2_56_31]HBB68341.1 hypothetical protein [Elusimicrobiota bacterium]HBW21990.1 hypothetical protein [Elusimicrobiota bacterium]